MPRKPASSSAGGDHEHVAHAPVPLPPGLKYDPSTGIYGMDFYVVMKRTGGMRVAKRRSRQGHIGNGHRVNTKETQKWFKDKYEGVLMN